MPPTHPPTCPPAQIDDEEDEAMIMDNLSASMVDVTAKVSAAAEKLAEGLRSMFGVKK